MLDDTKAIVDLTVAYAWALDTRRFDELRDVFTADATASLLGVECRGIDAIIERISGALSRLDASQHIVANHQVRIDGDRATCRCYLQAQHVKREVPDGDTFIIAGTYHDDLVRTPKGWRISHRVIAVVWTSGNPLVVKR
jgi:3-phenylpropionate/cinnamic acid dioxygenase small subunit